jgi:putative endonuclease
VGVAQWLDLPAGRQGAALWRRIQVEYYIYIIRSLSTGKFYTGMTNNFERRLLEHNGTRSNTFTTWYTHDYIVVFVEITDSRIKARKLEKYLKSGAGREFRSEIVSYLGHS